MNNAKMVSGIGQHHTNDADPNNPLKQLTPYGFVSWSDIRAMAKNPPRVDKSQGRWFIPSTFASRTFKEQEAHGEYWVLCFDFDENTEFSLEDIAALFDEVIKQDIELLAYHSRSATPESLKCRILIPLAVGVSYRDYKAVLTLLNNALDSYGLKPDRALERAAQLVYLPNKGEHYDYAFYGDSDLFFNPLDTMAKELDDYFTAEATGTEAARIEREARQDQARIKRESIMWGQYSRPIDAFNAAYTVDEMLTRHGYDFDGKHSYRHPNSESGSYSAGVENGRVYSLSPNDPLYTADTSNGAHDAFSVFCTLAHGGDQKAAIIDAGDNWLAIEGQPWNRVTQRAYIQVQEADNASLANKSAVSTHATSRKIDLVNAATIKPEAIAWLWNDWLARGKVHILAGAAGTGKTTLSLSIAATISKGGLFADGSKADRGNVIIWSGEDDASDTIIPRLIGAGADLSRIQIINGCVSNTERDAFDPSRDISLLQDAVTTMGGVSLFLIDPIVTAVTGDMHKANDVRRGLQPLVDFATQNNAAVLGITHFSKGSKGASPQERVIGSQAFSAVARVVLVAAKQDDGQARVLAKAKANICLDEGGIEYEIEPYTLDSGINTTRISWGKKIDGSSRDILDNVESPNFELDDDPKETLQRILGEGAKDSKDVKLTMERNGFSEKRTRKARALLNVVIARDGFGAETKTYWSLPPSR